MKNREVIEFHSGTKLALRRMDNHASRVRLPPSRGNAVISNYVRADVLAPWRLDREYSIMDRGTDGASENDNGLDTQRDSSDARRLGNPTRLYPRQTPPDDPTSVSPHPAVFEDEAEGPGPSSTFGRGGLGPMFSPRSFGNGRIQVWGCSPGCLIASLIASAVLTLLLNAIF